MSIFMFSAFAAFDSVGRKMSQLVKYIKIVQNVVSDFSDFQIIPRNKQRKIFEYPPPPY